MQILTYAHYEKNKAIWKSLVSPLKVNNLQPAGIDLTVGGQGVNLTTGEEASFEDGEVLKIGPGDFANVQTHEEVNLPGYIFGIIYAKATENRRGLTHFGNKIDPGFHGRLLLAFSNNGRRPISLKLGHPICMVMFIDMKESAGMEYAQSAPLPAYASIPPRLSLTPSPQEQEHYAKIYPADLLNLYEAVLRLYGEVDKLRADFKEVKEVASQSKVNLMIAYITNTVIGVAVAGAAVAAIVVTILVAVGD